MLNEVKSRFLSGKKLFKISILIIGLTTFTSAQGITNTLGGNTAAEKFIVENSDSETGLVVTGEGNVGIGTTSPISKLHIYDDVNSSLSLRLHNASTGTGAATKLYFDNSNYAGIAVFGSSHSNSANVMRIFNNRNSPDGSIDFVVNGNKKMVITSTGNVGIGTTNPLSKLSVGGDGHLSFTIYGEASGNSGRGVYGRATGSGGSGVYGSATGSESFGVYGLALNSGTGTNYGGYFKAAGWYGRGVYGIASHPGMVTNYGGFFRAEGSSGRGVYGQASNSGAGTNYGGYFEAAAQNGRGVYGYASGSSGHGVYGYASHSGALVTNYGGYFEAAGSHGHGVYGYATGSHGRGVYGQATGSTGSGVYGFANGSSGIAVLGSGGGAYDFYAAGSGTDYGAASSIRWKNNIVEIDNPLEKLAELRGVYFDWDEEHGGQHDIGCIAEEVGKVLPEIVVYEENGIDADGMDYSKLTPLLVEVAKAQQTLIDELTKRIEELENR